MRSKGRRGRDDGHVWVLVQFRIRLVVKSFIKPATVPPDRILPDRFEVRGSFAKDAGRPPALWTHTRTHSVHRRIDVGLDTLHACTHASKCAYIHTDIPTSLHTGYLHSYMHACILTYLHAYMHIYVNIFRFPCCQGCSQRLHKYTRI